MKKSFLFLVAVLVCPVIMGAQSIIVDKDGTMYGARGGNGVIKISTIASGVVMY